MTAAVVLALDHFLVAYVVAGAIMAVTVAFRLVELRDVVLDELSPLQCAIGLIMVAVCWPAFAAEWLGGDGPWRG